jgi:uncharacterized membrane protein YcaP (DUF421 family)
MWQLSFPWWHFVVRAVVVYFFMLVLLRMTGRRQVGQLAPFDLVLLLILSNAVQNAMNANDGSLTAGFILATTLVVLNGLVGRLTFHNKRLEALLEGRPEVLIYEGKVFKNILDREKISDLDLITALRATGCESTEDVHLAILENNGHVSVLRKTDETKGGSTPLVSGRVKRKT